MVQEVVANVVGHLVVGQPGQIGAIPAAIADIIVGEDLIKSDDSGERKISTARGDDGLVVGEVETLVVHGAKEIDAESHVGAQTRPARFEGVLIHRVAPRALMIVNDLFPAMNVCYAIYEPEIKDKHNASDHAAVRATVFS